MTATDELRRLLDERGVEWENGDAAYMTDWHTPDGRRCSAIYWHPGFSVCINDCTPEQAIVATLGRGTCRAVSMRERDNRPYLKDELVCNKCGCLLAHEFGHVWQNFCPNCGREVIE